MPADLIAAELEELDRRRAVIRADIDGRTIYTLTTWGSSNASGIPAYVRVFVARGADELEELTYWIAQIMGERCEHRGRFGLKRGGGGYNRALDVMAGAARALDTSFDQHRWREL